MAGQPLAFVQRPLPLRPDGAVGPGVHFPHRPDDAGADQFDGPADRLARMRLVAHLRLHFVVRRGMGHHASFVNRMRQRFLAVHVLAQRHGHYGRGGMRVVRSADGDRVDALFPFQHHAEIGVTLGFRKLGKRAVRPALVDVAQRHERAAGCGDVFHLAGAFAADTDSGDIETLVQRPRRGGEGT